MYYGRYEHKVDTKGRVQIPISLREAGDDRVYNRFVIVKGIGGCLVLFTRDVFDEFVEAFDPEQLGDGGTVEFMRQFFSRMHDVILDNQGRILLPKLLREEARIDSSVLLLGAGKWVEIWDKKMYEKYSSESELTYDEIARHFFATLGRKKNDQQQDIPTE